MTRARAKLLEQQVNSLLAQPDLCYDENFILPKSMPLCTIRFEEQLDMEAMELDEALDMEAMELNKELDMEDKQLDMKDKLLGMKTTSECAREEREAGAQQILKKPEDFHCTRSPTRYQPGPYPVLRVMDRSAGLRAKFVWSPAWSPTRYTGPGTDLAVRDPIWLGPPGVGLFQP